MVGRRVAGAEDFGAEEDLFAFVLDGFANDGFGAAFTVEGGVDKIATELDSTVNDLDADLFVVLCAKGRAQAELGEFDAGISQRALFHLYTP